MSLDKFIVDYPYIYHMAEYGSFENISKHGLLSTSALLDLYEVTGEKRYALEKCRRDRAVKIIHPTYGTAVIRDQKPMSDGKLSRCLDDGLTPKDWYQIINTMVFFWATKERLVRFLSTSGYKDKMQTILTVDTKKLVNCHYKNIRLSPINSGTTRHINHRRGRYTFLSIHEFNSPEHRKRGRKRKVAEVAVIYSVPDINEMIIRVDHIRGPEGVDKIT